MGHHLKTALIHLNVHYKEPARNRNRLLELNRKAAMQGCKLIVNTEMAISGYSFQRLEDIAPFVESDCGETITGLKAIAREFGVFICLGFAEKDTATGIYYNTAQVLDPQGKTVCKYHKVNAEARWACPGNGVQENVFDSPWGKIGVLICSDTYHGLIPRQTALKGANFIIVPANWPRGGLDPCELWRVRAMENGIFIAACNRGGKDRIMTCDDSPSAAYAPDGRELLSRSSLNSAIMHVDIPLIQGKIPGSMRKERLRSRSPGRYHPIYLDMRHVTYEGGDYTSYYDLNEPGRFHVSCHTFLTYPEEILERIRRFTPPEPDIFAFMVLPLIPGKDAFKILLPALESQIKNSNTSVCMGFKTHKGHENILLITPDGKLHPYGKWKPEHLPENRVGVHHPGDNDRLIVDVGPVRAGICTLRELVHPETALAHAKLGCDILLAPGDEIAPEWQSVFAAKTLEKISIAVAGQNMAFICNPPESHKRWKESLALEGAICTADMHSRDTRTKKFQDRIDFKTILQQTQE